jgi:hypothetical protein
MDSLVRFVVARPDLRHRRPVRIDWEEYPEGLRRDLESYLEGLTRPRRTRSGKRLRPCKPSTICTRRAELVACTRKAVEIGVPVEELTSLSALLRPDVVKQVIDAYWMKDGVEPKGYTIDLAWKLHSVARETNCLSATELEELNRTAARAGGPCIHIDDR